LPQLSYDVSGAEAKQRPPLWTAEHAGKDTAVGDFDSL
jgi:hypothetical protein